MEDWGGGGQVKRGAVEVGGAKMEDKWRIHSFEVSGGRVFDFLTTVLN